MNKYDPKVEYHVDLENLEVKQKVNDAKKLYLEFIEENFKKFDLANEQSIEAVYEKAVEAGIFEKAKEIRELIFDKDIHFYGVSYLWDACINHCQYCPGSVPNREKALKEGKVFPLRELSVDQAVEDTKAVMKDGQRHMCYLTGSTPSIDKYPDKIISYLKAVIEKTKERDLKEIILNIEPLTEEGFKKVADAVRAVNEKCGTRVSLQFRVFQETYNREVYAQMHPKGPKANYDFRIKSQARALRAGFDNVGLGALLGLNRYPFEEIEGLRRHAERLEKESGRAPSRICLPSANELENIGVEIPYFIRRGTYSAGRKELIEKGPYEKFNELIYALARLAMPKINIVSSERDSEPMLEILDKYATCTTLNVHPGVGDNAKLFPKVNCANVHFEQATVFPRDPKNTTERMKQRGYKPILGEIESDKEANSGEDDIGGIRGKLMKETSEEVGEIMLQYLFPLKEENKELYDICAELPLKKRHKLETRSFLLRMAFEICAGREWNEEVKHAAAAVEFLLCSMYYTNRVFDEKGGKEILSKPNNQIIAAMITRDLAAQALSKAIHSLDKEVAAKIRDALDEANKKVYTGQFMDLNQNIYQKDKNQNWEKIINDYYRRVYLINSSFYKSIALTGIILANGTQKQLEIFSDFAKYYGMMMQTINDISDFAPALDNFGTDAKVSEDAYGDIRHQKLTLPILWTLINGINKDKFLIVDVLENKKTDNETMLELTKRLVNNGAIDFAKDAARQYASKAKGALGLISNSRVDLLKNLCFMAYTNRYYKALHKYKK